MAHVPHVPGSGDLLVHPGHADGKCSWGFSQSVTSSGSITMETALIKGAGGEAVLSRILFTNFTILGFVNLTCNFQLVLSR